LASSSLRPDVEVGDILFVHPQTFHAAGIGTIDSPRIMLSLAVAAPDELCLTIPDTELLLVGEHAYQGQELP
jgi:ectoine hydroxylase-related dioxygenase (phytanoyl-CoA dioxygenase family)